MGKSSQVRPAVAAEATEVDKGVAIHMAALANLAYLKLPEVKTLREEDHSTCTYFDCKLHKKKRQEEIDKNDPKWKIDPNDFKKFCCEGVLKFVTGEELFEDEGKEKGKGAACYAGKYNGDVFISFRGTEDLADWKANLKSTPVPFWSCDEKPLWKKVFKSEPESNNTKVHQGFLEQFTSVVDKLKQFLENQSPATLYLTGHSLGGALASISSLFFSHLLPKCNIKIITFGAPRSVTDGFAEAVQKRGNIVASFRFQAHYDLVPVQNYPKLRHIAGGGNRNGEALSAGEFTIRYKRILKTNDPSDTKDEVYEKHFRKHNAKLTLWAFFDYSSSLSFHSQDLYQDKLVHAWKNGNAFKKWKDLEIHGAPKSFQFIVWINTFLNISVAFAALRATLSIMWDFLSYDASFDNDDPEYKLCVRPIVAYDWSAFSDAGAEDLSVNSTQKCEPTPGFLYAGSLHDDAKCPKGYTCSTDYNYVGYTWMADAGHKMPYCLHNEVKCGDLEYCAGYVELAGDCHPDNKPCNGTPPSSLIYLTVFCLYVSFIFTLELAVVRLCSLCPGKFCPVHKRTGGVCSRKKRKLSPYEAKQECGKSGGAIDLMDTAVKLYLFYQLVVNNVLEFLATFLAAKCLDPEGIELYTRMNKEANSVHDAVVTLVVFKLLTLMASALRFYVDPTNQASTSRKSFCNVCKKENSVHWFWT